MNERYPHQRRNTKSLLRRVSVIPVVAVTVICLGGTAPALPANTYHLAQVGRVRINAEGFVRLQAQYLCPDGAHLIPPDSDQTTFAHFEATQFRTDTGEVSRQAEARFDPICDGAVHTIAARFFRDDESEVRFSRTQPLNVTTSLTVMLPDSDRTVTAYDYKWVLGPDGGLLADIDVKNARVLDESQGLFRVRLAGYCRPGGTIEDSITVAVGQPTGGGGGTMVSNRIVCDGGWHYVSTRVALSTGGPVNIAEPLGVYGQMTVRFADIPTPPFGMIVEDQVHVRLS
jgi:hypothetical protein